MKRYAMQGLILAVAALMAAAVVNVAVQPAAYASSGECQAPDWRERPGFVPYAYEADGVWIAPTGNGTSVGSLTAPLEGKVAPGDVVRITATGRVSYGGWFNWRGTWGPGGNGQRVDVNASSAWPFRGGRDAALVGKWNNTDIAFDVGLDSRCIRVPAGAWWGFQLIPNDGERWDNGDIGYTARVEVTHMQKFVY